MSRILEKSAYNNKSTDHIHKIKQDEIRTKNNLPYSMKKSFKESPIL